MSKWMVVVGVLIAIAGCKKADPPPASTGSSSGSGSGSGSGSSAGSSSGSSAVVGPGSVVAPGSAASPDAGVAPDAGAAATAGSAKMLPPGEMKPGCFAWSATKQAAACSVGMVGVGISSEYAIVTVGATVTIIDKIQADGTIPGSIPTITGDGFDEVLARDGFAPLAGAAQEVTAKPVEVNGVAFTFTSKQIAPSGHQMPPTKREAVRATCGGKTVTVFEHAELGETLAPRVRAADAAHVVVELPSHTGMEGEIYDTMRVVLFDVKTCTGVKAE